MKHIHKAKGPVLSMKDYEPTEINTMMRAKMMEGAVPRGACDQGLARIARAPDMKWLYEREGDWVLEKTPFKEILIRDMAAAKPDWFLNTILGLFLALHGHEEYSPKWWVEAGIKITQEPLSGEWFQVRYIMEGTKYGDPQDSMEDAIALAKRRARQAPGRVMVITQALCSIVATARKAERDNARRGLPPDDMVDAAQYAMRSLSQKRIVWEGPDPAGYMGRVASMLNGHEVRHYEVSFDRSRDETILTLRLRG